MIIYYSPNIYYLCYEQLLILSDSKVKQFPKFQTDGLAYFDTVFFLTPNYSEDFLSNTLPQQIHSPQRESAF